MMQLGLGPTDLKKIGLRIYCSKSAAAEKSQRPCSCDHFERLWYTVYNGEHGSLMESLRFHTKIKVYTLILTHSRIS